MIGRFIAYICEFEASIFNDVCTSMSRSTDIDATFFVDNFWNFSRIFIVCRGTCEEYIVSRSIGKVILYF